MTDNQILTYGVCAIIGGIVLYVYYLAFVRAWFAEKRKHLDGVLKKIEKEK